jgi:hypothetical protein
VAGLKEAGVEVIHAHGQLSGNRQVTLAHADGHKGSLSVRHAVVLVTGTRPAIPDIPGLANAQPWTNRDLSVMTRTATRAGRRRRCRRRGIRDHPGWIGLRRHIIGARKRPTAKL